VFDLVLGTVLLIIAFPIILIAAAAIRIESTGSPFFVQTRLGKNGHPFKIIKLRGMYADARTRYPTYYDYSAKQDLDFCFHHEVDPRVTRAGKFIRKTSIDELPNLWNVVLGDMSLVGPRPERPYFVQKFRTNIQKYNLRHCCQVGMTGWAQVHGLRGDTSIPDRLRYDLHYIHNWSFGLDLHILARTMLTALKNENGY